MNKFDKFKEAFTIKHPSVNEEHVLENLFKNLDMDYIDELIRDFDFKRAKIKEIVVNNIIKTNFLSIISDSYHSDEPLLVNRYYDDIEKLSDSIYSDIKTLILGE